MNKTTEVFILCPPVVLNAMPDANSHAARKNIKKQLLLNGREISKYVTHREQ